ncbi:MAG: class I mannose-6-phosphate isomerase [Muribaculaceae bacterium]|nr:class I mannose-6-phosphate isomerase [Muribaculaceae bacterium]
MFKFQPILRSVLWGGNRIAAYKQIETELRQIGESWEISGVEGHESVVASAPDAGLTLPELVAKYRDKLVGESVYARYGNEFPLLVKIIDAERDLSLQVHPDDILSARRHGCPGKTEMWHIIEAAPGAQIIAGFEREVNPGDFERMALDGSIMRAVRHYASQAGDTFFLPPGTIHSIGAGNLLAEIQQTSNITYRVYDYRRRDALGNQRELHTDLAREALNFGIGGEHKVLATGSRLVACEHFVVERLSVDGRLSLPCAGIDSFVVLMCIGGELRVSCEQPLAECASQMALYTGETLLLPACAKQVAIAGQATALATWVPTKK